MINNENKIKLMKMVSELEQLKDKLNETIEFFLDRKEYYESDEIHIELIKKKLDNLKLCIEKTGKEFNKKRSVKEENNKRKIKKDEDYVASMLKKYGRGNK